MTTEQQPKSWMNDPDAWSSYYNQERSQKQPQSSQEEKPVKERIAHQVKTQPGPGELHWVFVGNLCKTVTDKVLRMAFSHFGDIR